MEQLKDQFMRCGLQPSHQRLSIYSHLRSRYDHPTAEMVYDSLVGEMPTLSKTTVYNTLRLFCEKGMAALIHTEDSQMRFDANTTFHVHFKCLECGQVTDVAAGGEFCSRAEKIALPGHVIQSKQLILFGTCPLCSAGWHAR